MKRVKICGLFRTEDIETVNRLKPDYCGFVINFPASHRSLAVEDVRNLVSGLCSEVQPVGVFVDQPPETVAGLLEDETLAVAQLHGSEDQAYIRHLRGLTGKPIWQAFQIRGQEDVKKASDSPADFVLLDAGQGGGTVFSWDLVRDFPRPFGLAGGLNLDNLSEALQTQADLLDVSGGVETDKIKDPVKIERFIACVRTEDGCNPACRQEEEIEDEQ